MSDYISRQAAIEALDKCQQYKVSKEDYAVDFAEVKTELMMLPTADVVEVVRCRECKFLYFDENDDIWKCPWTIPSGADGYCSYGKRADT